MLGIVGTIPQKDFPLVYDEVSLKGENLLLGEKLIPVNRGTPAMIAAAVATLNYMGKAKPTAYLVGDIGDGRGCEKLYKYLTSKIRTIPLKTLALHYFQPDVLLFKELLAAVNTMPQVPTLIADAGFMYVAKMGGDAPSFDLFTPDVGELAYLADEKAPHPFYTRGFILHEDNRVPDLIRKAYQHNNASKYMLVKGVIDYVVNQDGILAQIDTPNEEVLEAIGGTGDTLTGIVSALVAAGIDTVTSATKAAKVNRIAGFLAEPTPATQVYDIIKQIPYALKQVFEN